MDNLTQREKEVLKLMKDGYGNNEIAKLIFVSKYTVKAHVSSILRKTQAKNRAHLIYIAAKSGLLD
ncbi:MAG: LuxR C-terminal-related transcriptional regulator [Heliobacteriaceae bacterium]|jgi:DNA-binding NarL/FixJ family response regulator|nr:LuxR C-terminal-related transcriptional regulator [Heliobacteriaceae bacterium]